MRRSRAALLVFVVLAASLGTGTATGAAVEPGTPVAVAPGVPGHGRAWELVTPADPVAALMYNVRALSASGDRVSYMTVGPLPGAPAGAPFPTANISVRGMSGWVNQPLAAPYPLLGGTEVFYRGPLALSPDFETSIWSNYLPLRPGESEEEVGLLRQGPDGTFALLAEIGRSGRFLGASADMETVFFTSEQHLLAADATRIDGQSIYEIDGPTVRLVDVNNDGSLLSDCGSSVPQDEYGAATAGVVSADGQRLFFSARPSCAGPSRVYLRQAGALTTEISASQCDFPDCGPEVDVTFAGATPSGSGAFLVTSQRLTDDDSNSYADLYRFDVASGRLTLLSSSASGDGVAVTGNRVQTSADGSRVYFSAATQSGSGGGAEHLYLADGGDLHVVGPPNSLVQLSDDGRYALLSTNDALIAGDTDEGTDLYRYDAGSGERVALSIAPDVGNGPFGAVTVPTYFAETALTQPYRSMSADGHRIFFSSDERLVSGDRNYTTDVYEWADGGLGLISSGAGDRPDVYLGATPDGRTVLFRTTATLLASDRDGGEMDFYATRIGGGFLESPGAEGCGNHCAGASQRRADRAVPGSARPGSNTIRIRQPGPAERRRFAASGWITLLAEVPDPGHLAVAARAPIGGRARPVASTKVTVTEAGPVRLRMRLSEEARHRLEAGDPLQVRLGLRLSSLASTRKLSFELRRAP